MTPHLYTMHDRQYTSTEVSITGQRGEWFALKAYSVNPEVLPEALPQIEAALLRAWNALTAPPPSGLSSRGARSDGKTSEEGS